MVLAKPAAKLTYADYLSYPGDQRCELIDGELIVVGSPSITHQMASMALSLEMGGYARERELGWVFHAPTDVVLTDTDVVQPDLFFVAADQEHIITHANIQDAPDLIVEILSPSTARLDRAAKRSLYARHGVREYWIVDPLARSVVVMLLTDDDFEVIGEYQGEDAPMSTTLRGFTVSLTKIFR